MTDSIIIKYKYILTLLLMAAPGIASAQYLLAKPIPQIEPANSKELIVSMDPYPKSASVGVSLPIKVHIQNKSDTSQNITSIKTSGQLRLVANGCNTITPQGSCTIEWESLAYLSGPSQATIVLSMPTKIGEYSRVINILRQ